jgi:hypothetical protein
MSDTTDEALDLAKKVYALIEHADPVKREAALRTALELSDMERRLTSTRASPA